MKSLDNSKICRAIFNIYVDGNQPKYREVTLNTDLTFMNNIWNNYDFTIKEKVLKQKFSEMDTGGVGTSIIIENVVIYDPNKPLFTFNEGFKTLDEIDGKFLKDYLHLWKKVEFTPLDERKFKILYKNYRKGENK